jgi:hypothetical protein
MAMVNLVNGVKFKFGQLVMTRGVNDKVADDTPFAKFVLNSIRRHANGDWGDLGKEDKATNDNALKAEQEGKDTERLFSKYKHSDGTAIYIITEWDRSVTTVLFPDEY